MLALLAAPLAALLLAAPTQAHWDIGGVPTMDWPTPHLQAQQLCNVSWYKHYDDAVIPNHAEKPEFRKPDIAWVPSISPAGLIFYTGDKIKDWKDKAILGGLSSEAVIVVSFDGGKVAGAEIIKMGKRIREVAQAPDGAVMLLVDGESGGDLLRLAPAGEAEAG